MDRILMVEDNLEMVATVRKILSTVATVDHAYLREDVKQKLVGGTYELFLVDLNLPDSHGYDVFSMIRHDDRHQGAPVVFLTGDASDQSQVTGFGLGADDYITKPIRASAFRARISGRLKARKEQASRLQCYGSICIDLAAFQAYVDLPNGGKRGLDLTPLEFRILGVLLRRKEQVVERRTLIREAWGKGIHVTNRVADQHISALRRKFPTDLNYIQTVYGVGYKLGGLETPPRTVNG